MFKLEKEKTVSTPYILIDEERGYMTFEGESFPENVIRFYSDITDWIYDYLKSSFQAFTFDCKLVYFNSSTSKFLLNIFTAMDEAAAEGKRVIVNWTCDSHNEIIIECAEAFAEDFPNLKFRILRKDMNPA